jgi:hypothetical protein
MSEPENFLSRWSRLKRESGSEASDGDPERVADALPDVSVPSALDLTDLPALRSAWTADPAIRSFVGIADNQWDFNVEGEIPGFGSLEAADYAVNVVTRSLGSIDTGVIGALAPAEANEQPAPLTIESESAVAIEEAQQLTFVPADSPETSLDPQVMRTHGGALPKWQQETDTDGE